MMSLKKTDDLQTQIEIGKEIVSRHPEVYQGMMLEDIQNNINRSKVNAPFSKEELFYIATCVC